jgi:hypothetical protein
VNTAATLARLRKAVGRKKLGWFCFDVIVLHDGVTSIQPR